MDKLYYVLAIILVVGVMIYIMKNQSSSTPSTQSIPSTQSTPSTQSIPTTQPNENPNDIIPLVSYPDLVLDHPIYYDRYRYDYPYFRHYHYDHRDHHDKHNHHNNHAYVDHTMPSKPIPKYSKPVKPMPKPKK